MAINIDPGYNLSDFTPITAVTTAYYLDPDNLITVVDEPGKWVGVLSRNEGFNTDVRVTLAATKVEDVYRSHKDMDIKLKTGIKSGVQILVKIEIFPTVTDTDNPTFLNMYPITMHKVLHIPRNQYVTESALTELDAICNGLLFKSSTGASRINELIRYACNPLLNRTEGT